MNLIKIYNVEQARLYAINGVIPVEIKWVPQNKKYCFFFNEEETKQVWEIWKKSRHKF